MLSRNRDLHSRSLGGRHTAVSNQKFAFEQLFKMLFNRLVEQIPLPTLLMRTVIQSHTMYPRLAGFIINILQRLVLKQVWKHKLIWDGFIKCCYRLQQQSMSVLTQLQVPQLQDALNICPELKAPLLEYAREMNNHQISNVSQQVMEMLLGPGSQSSDSFQVKQEPMEESESTGKPPGVD